jgi:ribosomal protein L31E
MAKATQAPVKTFEREYVIPLRSEWRKVPRYKRTAKGVKAIKEFIAKHMRVVDRDTSKVKLDVYLNNELWFRGAKHTYNKIKVRAKKEGEIVRVELVLEPEKIKFLKARQEKIHKKTEKKEVKPEEKKETLEEKTEEEKKDESEKEKSAAQSKEKFAEQAAKAQKHTVKGKEPVIQRKALKK